MFAISSQRSLPCAWLWYLATQPRSVTLAPRPCPHCPAAAEAIGAGQREAGTVHSQPGAGTQWAHLPLRLWCAGLGMELSSEFEGACLLLVRCCLAWLCRYHSHCGHIALCHPDLPTAADLLAARPRRRAGITLWEGLRHLSSLQQLRLEHQGGGGMPANALACRGLQGLTLIACAAEDWPATALHRYSELQGGCSGGGADSAGVACCQRWYESSHTAAAINWHLLKHGSRLTCLTTHPPTTLQPARAAACAACSRCTCQTSSCCIPSRAPSGASWHPHSPR